MEQVHALSAAGAAGEPCNNHPSMEQMSSGGLGFKTHGCWFRRTCGGFSAVICMICLKSLQVLEFLLKSWS